jgi:hypothetical protein
MQDCIFEDVDQHLFEHPGAGEHRAGCTRFSN